MAGKSGAVNSLESECPDCSPETSSQAWGEETQGLQARWENVILGVVVVVEDSQSRKKTK